MEAKIMEILWSRSVERHGLQYTIMVSDGDSKAFNRLLEVEPYGPDVSLSKENCTNHVGKCLSKTLHNLVADCSKKGHHSWAKGTWSSHSRGHSKTPDITRTSNSWQ
ncbi:hypothetical protein ElyMa_003158500 [Elysia marginata]|uniref:Mutator-like transposase domain-containing protein n=1 Tax=Elysia marginata TaxID=1093978 RepID=A0AAV4IYI3_9GAST|nr:hypothetical protein ElyMa_003158500 [Elysia marginata]